MARERVYGEIPGFPEGSGFPNRVALQASGVHRPRQGGISGGKDGADSIVVSGGYPDDEDFGDVLIYTGQGGRDPRTDRQIADQELVLGNLGLARSELDDRPIRVIRGAGGDPVYSPKQGLRYDGLFQVVGHWRDLGRDGFRIWRFRLVKLQRTAAAEASQTTSAAPPSRVGYTGERIVRDRAIADRVKKFHKFMCQVCGIQLNTAAGPYAEGAHIRALGRPHEGPDDESNMLCLCPNHHLLFDAGAIYVDPGGSVWDALKKEIIGPLRTVNKHRVDPDQLRYHREHYAAS